MRPVVSDIINMKKLVKLLSVEIFAQNFSIAYAFNNMLLICWGKCLDHTQEMSELSYHLAASIHFDSMKLSTDKNVFFCNFITFCKCGHNSLIKE